MIKIVTFFLVALMMVGQPNNGNQNIIGSADVESDIKIITGQAPTETVVEELPLTISNEDLAQYQPNEMGGVVVAM
ncbi:MAG: hypothetical protein CSA13_00790 [Clostridiales bacterium]|nr:MAG: hypothetical protein CSA13_00790 [Clostridiales bacterium]